MTAATTKYLATNDAAMLRQQLQRLALQRAAPEAHCTKETMQDQTVQTWTL